MLKEQIPQSKGLSIVKVSLQRMFAINVQRWCLKRKSNLNQRELSCQLKDRVKKKFNHSLKR